MKVDNKFDPAWDLVYLYDKQRHEYRVIKQPEPIFGEDLDKLYVREGCTVLSDGQWWYWKLEEAEEYSEWKEANGLIDMLDNPTVTPDFIFSNRINGGNGTVGHPAPRFLGRDDNNWAGLDPMEVPMHLNSEMLGDLVISHLMLSEYLQDGVENPKDIKK